jgi:hypothetical protein
VISGLLAIYGLYFHQKGPVRDGVSYQPVKEEEPETPSSKMKVDLQEFYKWTRDAHKSRLRKD